MSDLELTPTVECSCGCVFEPEDSGIEVDREGERWVVCPACKQKLRLPEETDD
jgi:hypothetical protein